MPLRKFPLIANHYYHVYNRGVEKRQIFFEVSDYQTFIDIFSYYARPKIKNRGKPVLSVRTGLSGLGLFEKEIKILCYCLMPNHFHFLFFQSKASSISQLMKRCCIAYVDYFNKKYIRVGPLFQGRFKAKFVGEEEYLLHLSHYIHRNPAEFLESPDLSTYPWSSYREYLGLRRDKLSQPDLILGYFSSQNRTFSYRSLVENLEVDEEIIEGCVFDEK